MKRIYSKAGMVGLVCVYAMLVSGVAIGADKDESGKNNTPKVETSQRIHVILVPLKQAVLSAQVSTSVKTVKKELGQAFKKGDVLIELDDTIYQANYDKAAARLKAAKSEKTRQENLANQDSGALADLEKAKMDVAVAEANMKIAEKEKKWCRIEAPYAGRVKKVIVNENEVVRPGEKLIEILDDRTLLAQFLLQASFLDKVKLGQKVTIEMKNIMKPVEGKISHIGADIDPVSSTIRVFAKIDNTRKRSNGKTLVSGMSGTLKLFNLEKTDE